MWQLQMAYYGSLEFKIYRKFGILRITTISTDLFFIYPTKFKKFKFQISNFKFQISNFKFQNSKFKILGNDPRPQTRDTRTPFVTRLETDVSSVYRVFAHRGICGMQVHILKPSEIFSRFQWEKRPRTEIHRAFFNRVHTDSQGNLAPEDQKYPLFHEVSEDASQCMKDRKF